MCGEQSGGRGVQGMESSESVGGKGTEGAECGGRERGEGVACTAGDGNKEDKGGEQPTGAVRAGNEGDKAARGAENEVRETRRQGGESEGIETDVNGVADTDEEWKTPPIAKEERAAWRADERGRVPCIGHGCSEKERGGAILQLLSYQGPDAMTRLLKRVEDMLPWAKAQIPVRTRECSTTVPDRVQISEPPHRS